MDKPTRMTIDEVESLIEGLSCKVKERILLDIAYDVFGETDPDLGQYINLDHALNATDIDSLVVGLKQDIFGIEPDEEEE